MDFLYGPDAEEPVEPPRPSSRSSLRAKLAIVGVCGLMFTGAVFGLSGLASADAGESSGSGEPASSEESAPPEQVAEDDGDADRADEVSQFDGFSDEDQAFIREFEECLAEAGLGEDTTEADLSDEDFDSIDAAFENCEPILDDLSFDSGIWLEGEDDLSDEDAAVFERFDQCLTDAEHDLEADDYLSEEDFGAIDAALENCESILDDLSFDVDDFFGDAEFFDDGDIESFAFSEGDEALFEEFEACLTDAGIEELQVHDGEDGDEGEGAGSLTFEHSDDLDSIFEDCGAILEELSEGPWFLLEDCWDAEEDYPHELEDDIEDSLNA